MCRQPVGVNPRVLTSNTCFHSTDDSFVRRLFTNSVPWLVRALNSEVARWLARCLMSLRMTVQSLPKTKEGKGLSYKERREAYSSSPSSAPPC